MKWGSDARPVATPYPVWSGPTMTCSSWHPAGEFISFHMNRFEDSHVSSFYYLDIFKLFKAGTWKQKTTINVLLFVFYDISQSASLVLLLLSVSHTPMCTFWSCWNSMKILNCVSRVFRLRMTPDGTLVIRNMERKDGGVYGCLASNQAGTDTMTSILTYIGECHRTHASIHPSIH